jgi:hypothetical protein
MSDSEALASANASAANENTCSVAATVAPCPRTCQIEGLELKCGHSGRKHVVKVRPGETVVLEVIADSIDGDDVHAQVEGNCARGGNSTSVDAGRSEDWDRWDGSACPAIHIQDCGAGHQVRSGGEVKFRGKGKALSVSQVEDWSTFFKSVLIPGSVGAAAYTVSTSKCSCQPGSLRAKVLAYPPVGWNGKVSLSYVHKPHKDSNFNRNQGFRNLKVQGEWEIEGEIEGTYDRLKFKLGKTTSKKGAHQSNNMLTRGLFEGAQGFLNKITPFLGDLKSDYGQISIKWPRISLGGGVKNLEIENAAEVGLQGTVAIAMEPLLGAAFTTDILNWILKIGGDSLGGFGSFLVKVKGKAAAGIGGETVAGKAVIALELTVAGDIAGSFGWKITGPSWQVDDEAAEVTGGIGFSLEGKAYVEGRILKVVSGAGAYVRMTGADNSTSSKITGHLKPLAGASSPTPKVYLAWNGLAIYYAMYAHIGAEDLVAGPESRKTVEQRRAGKGLFSGEPARAQTEEFGKLCEIAAPVKWPKGEEAIPLNSGRM